MKLTWPHVAVIGLVLGAVVTLAALGRDTSALIGLGTLLFAGIGVVAAGMVGIKDQTNGNTSKLLTMVERMSEMLAQMRPPAPPPSEQSPDEHSPS